MMELHAETGTTLVIVTHDLAVAQIAERRFDMRDGAIVDIQTRERGTA
jgi:predicted ABC-type transport system involved in lysophospholipase L1 biosynthesis ATPase subunit